jgi:hypothetical protein
MAEQTWHYLFHWLSLMCRAAWGSHIVRFVPCCGHAIINYIFEFTFHINYTSPRSTRAAREIHIYTHAPLSLSQSLSLFFGAERPRSNCWAASEWTQGWPRSGALCFVADLMIHLICDFAFLFNALQLSNLFTWQSHFNDIEVEGNQCCYLRALNWCPRTIT